MSTRNPLIDNERLKNKKNGNCLFYARFLTIIVSAIASAIAMTTTAIIKPTTAGTKYWSARDDVWVGAMVLVAWGA